MEFNDVASFGILLIALAALLFPSFEIPLAKSAIAAPFAETLPKLFSELAVGRSAWEAP